MPLPFSVDAIDAVPEAQRSLYKEANGKFVLDVDGYEDPANLKSALQKEREAAKTAAQQVKAWSALGKTPEEIQALVEAQAKSEHDNLTKNGEWDKLRDQMVSQHKTELSKKDEAIQARESALSRHLVDAAAVTAVADAKGSAALLLPHIRAAVKVVEEDGEYVVRVVDKNGPRVNGKGEFLTIKDLVAEMRLSDEFGRAFDATGTTGGGATNGGGGGGSKTMAQAAFDALSPKQRAAKMAEGYRVV